MSQVGFTPQNVQNHKNYEPAPWEVVQSTCCIGRIATVVVEFLGLQQLFADELQTHRQLEYERLSILDAKETQNIPNPNNPPPAEDVEIEVIIVPPVDAPLAPQQEEVATDHAPTAPIVIEDSQDTEVDGTASQPIVVASQSLPEEAPTQVADSGIFSLSETVVIAEEAPQEEVQNDEEQGTAANDQQQTTDDDINNAPTQVISREASLLAQVVPDTASTTQEIPDAQPASASSSLVADTQASSSGAQASQTFSQRGLEQPEFKFQGQPYVVYSGVPNDIQTVGVDERLFNPFAGLIPSTAREFARIISRHAEDLTDFYLGTTVKSGLDVGPSTYTYFYHVVVSDTEFEKSSFVNDDNGITAIELTIQGQKKRFEISFEGFI